jgi:hypothetical protein
MLLALGCERQRAEPAEELPSVDGVPIRNLDAAAVADYDPHVDYFPDKAVFRHATTPHRARSG